MKKYLVVATICVALVVLFSFGVSAASVDLDATASISTGTSDAGATVTLDSISIRLDGGVTTTGYYTVLAKSGDDIVYVAQDTAPITGFNLNPTALTSGALTVKFGGKDLTTAASDNATFKFAFVALNSDGKAIKLLPYGDAATMTTDSDSIDQYVVYGAKIVTAAQAEAAGYSVATGETECAIRSFRTFVPLSNN